uniref:InlA n=1 Tax=Ganoderma boninense TaxID=34458 RepID=A0A5K1JT82_9APHY
MESLPQSYPCLRSLKLERASMDLNDLRPLADLPNLEHLSVSHMSFSDSSYPLTLAGLLSLTVSTSSLRDILFTHLNVPRLQSFSLSETRKDSSHISQEFPNYLRTLLTKCPALTAFSWTSTQVWRNRKHSSGTRRADAPLAELVAPLLEHRTLRHFEMQLCGPIVPYTPSDFGACAEAWPDLEEFCLSDEQDDGTGTWKRGERYVDVGTLFEFARNCPGLHRLALPRVERFGSGALLQFERCPPARHWLRELSVDKVVRARRGQDRDRHEELVAQFRGLLVEVFPSGILRLDG